MVYTSYAISTSGKINYWEGQENQKHEDLLLQNISHKGMILVIL